MAVSSGPSHEHGDGDGDAKSDDSRLVHWKRDVEVRSATRGEQRRRRYPDEQGKRPHTHATPSRAVGLPRKRCGAGRSGARKTVRRPATGRASLNGRAARSNDGTPEHGFSGLRSGFRGEPTARLRARCSHCPLLHGGNVGDRNWLSRERLLGAPPQRSILIRTASNVSGNRTMIAPPCIVQPEACDSSASNWTRETT
jgi:hypothetical protein